MCDTTHSCVKSENNCTLEHESSLSLSSYLSLTNTNAFEICVHTLTHAFIHTYKQPISHELRIEGDAKKLIPQNLQVSFGSIYIKRDLEVLGLSFIDQTFDLQTVRDMCEFSIYVGLAVRTYVQAYVHICIHT